MKRCVALWIGGIDAARVSAHHVPYPLHFLALLFGVAVATRCDHPDEQKYQATEQSHSLMLFPGHRNSRQGFPRVASIAIGPSNDVPALGAGGCAGGGILSCCVFRRISLPATRT